MILSRILSVATLVAPAVTSPLASREAANPPLIHCNGLLYPDYSDCDALTSDWKDNTDVLHKPADKPNGLCVTPKTGHCQVSICFKVDGYAEVTLDEMYNMYNAIKGLCEVQKAGGTYDLGSKVFTVERGDTHALLARNETELDFQKRIDPNDNDFELIEQDDYVERPGAKQFITRQPDKAMYKVESTKSKTVSVSVSVEVKASYLEIISTSIGTTVDTSDTVSSTVGYVVNINCNGKEGAIYWTPLWNHYYGRAKPSNEEIDIWIPVDQSGDNYSVECLG